MIDLPLGPIGVLTSDNLFSIFAKVNVVTEQTNGEEDRN